MALRKTPSQDLDQFIADHLFPDPDFRWRVRSAIDTLYFFLKTRCFRNASHPVRVSKVVKGSSSGKGTGNRSHANLVVFLENLSSFQEQFDRRAEFTAEIKKQLIACQREQQFRLTFKVKGSWWPWWLQWFLWWSTPKVLSFTLSDPDLLQEVEFDVLLASDALGYHSTYRPDPQIYVRLIKECTSLQKEGEFSTCFTELQREFLKQRPPKLRSLVCLVQHWYQLCKEKLGEPLPPQYALELLTVYAWEHRCEKTHFFITAQGFKTVLLLVMEYQQLRIYWTEYYDFNDDPLISDYLHRQLWKTRPVILDPADPTGNVATENLDGWRRLAGEAKAWLQYPCCKKSDGSSVGSWDVPMEVDVPTVQDSSFRGFSFFLVFLLLVVLFGASPYFFPLLILLIYAWVWNFNIFRSTLLFLVIFLFWDVISAFLGFVIFLLLLFLFLKDCFCPGDLGFSLI